ncbi:hypothetical protein PGH12_01300 [Chryseobacterium wangxinyae]|uniref:nSTAND3 domain-containing NTPase n=1 Tax=Chryseobacterium sp. CY350 TaxID=2997336 RepID=UPI002271AD3E|nr:hypothetical protein [Chryseobacterium sp. CY350]MCY0977183.1 hypothetical protein [Chryseobacterium sp. CY350]WBZ95796.1 hypothetical protein PGH12_01300 [Chryseobacterium sp. CY350]
MNGRLKLIEQQLIGIDSAAFQNLCDVYLNFKENDLQSISRAGSQFGKQKPIKGTPDTFFRNGEGKLIFVEFTTTNIGIVKKLKGDISKCIDSSFTKIDSREIEKIILFFNSRLAVKQEQEIFRFAKDKNVFIELIGLDKLALDIYINYPILSRDILGIALETGQILPLSSFIKEYNNKGGNLSTPLDNPFLNRGKELLRIKNSLANKDIIVLSGSAGVGKTKLSLKSIEEFKEENIDFTSYVIVNKDADIWEDVRMQLQKNKNYILLIDDANRQLNNFNQILGILNEERRGKVKIIITARDYAIDHLFNASDNIDYDLIEIEKFSDEEIRELISNDFFNIKNSKYQDKIIALADGNSRLAIMAAKLAMEKQLNFLQGGVYNLYDHYFQTFIKDFDLFNNPILLKTIGIVSFFFTIQRDDKEFIEKLINDFDINHIDFHEAIDELHRRELVEIKGSYVRISEQVMSTYFFYKVFIKDKVLPFKKLLFEYFEKYNSRFKETVILCNNTFGYHEVLEKIQLDIDLYFQTHISNEEKIIQFIKLFWFYKREETLYYIYNKVVNTKQLDDPYYISTYGTNEFVYEEDIIISLLNPFFTHYTEDSFISSVELAFEYVKRNHEAFPELIRRLKENISFDDDDEFNNNFEKQKEFCNLLISRSNEGQIHYKEAFLGLASNFLKHSNRVFKTARNENAFTHYNYSIPLNETVKYIRTNAWKHLFLLYDKYPERVLKIINDWKPFFGDMNKKMLTYDLSLILPFIEEKLDSKSFTDINFVQNFVSWLRYNKITNIKYLHLNKLFSNSEYDDFKVFDWTGGSRKKNIENLSHADYKKMRTTEISKHFIFKNTSDFKRFGTLLKNNFLAFQDSGRNLDSVNVIIESTFKRNKKIGFELLKYFLKNHAKTRISIPYKAVSLVTNDEEFSSLFYKFLKSWKHLDCYRLKFVFFEVLEEHLVTQLYVKELYSLVKNIDDRIHFGFSWLSKFSKYQESIFTDFLHIIYKKKVEGLPISIDDEIFENFTFQLKDDITILQKLYLLEIIANPNHFDYERDGLKSLLEIDKDFIFRYVELHYYTAGRKKISSSDNLGFVWEMYNDDYLEELFKSIIKNTLSIGFGEEEIDMFFKNISETGKAKALVFLRKMIVKKAKNVPFVNCVIRLIRRYYSHEFENFLLLYVEHNANTEDFSRIWWRGNGGTYSGDVNIGEVHRNDWQRIYKIIEKGKNQLNLIPIKNSIKEEINSSIEQAERERLRKFIRSR